MKLQVFEEVAEGQELVSGDDLQVKDEAALMIHVIHSVWLKGTDECQHSVTAKCGLPSCLSQS